MKKLFVLLSLTVVIYSMSFGQGLYENEGMFSDTLKTKKQTSLYITPQTIYYKDDTLTTKISQNTILISKYFKDNYYKVEFNGETGYVFCLDVETPSRINLQQKWLQLLVSEHIINTEENISKKDSLISYNKKVNDYFSSKGVYGFVDNEIIKTLWVDKIKLTKIYDEKVNAKSQSYSTYLELVKNEKPDIYKYIKISAENKWVTDYEMIKYTIENQCKGYIEFIELYSKYENHKDKKAICINAYSEWKDGEIVDWEMVVYTIKNQLKSYGSY